jgi:spermidine synthase
LALWSPKSFDDSNKDELLKNQHKNWILLLFGISGMTALIYEIIWIRPLSLVFGTTIYAFSTIIASFILGLAVGSWIAGKYTDRMKNPLKYFAFVHLGIAFFGLLLLPLFSILPGLYLEIYKATFPQQSFFMLIQIFMSMAMISLPAALMGSTLPIMMKTYSKKFSTIGNDVGKLDGINSLGAMFGTLAAGFLLIPLVGIEGSIIFTALINAGIGILILTVKKFIKFRFLIAIIAIAIMSFLFLPNYDAELLNFGIFHQADPDLAAGALNAYAENYDVLFYKDSLYSSIMVSSVEDLKVLRINGKPQCNNSPTVVTGLNHLASFPYELFEHNYGQPKNALNIGLGCGLTSKWLSERTETTTLEIDPAIVEASKFFVDDIDHNLIIDDGRNWLMRNDYKFDIITTQPTDPYQNQGSFYTWEFFSLINNRLSENGILSQWVPIYEMTLDDVNIFYNTFHSVFPYVYVYSLETDNVRQLVFIGSQNEIKIKENLYYLQSHKDITLVETELNTDNRPYLEFATAINFQNPNQNDEIKRIMFEWLKLDPQKAY